jgi:hypothetical protein
LWSDPYSYRKQALFQEFSTENIFSYLDGLISIMRLFVLLVLVFLGMHVSAQQKYPQFSVSINQVNFDANDKTG